ncbi:hypothetical protein L1987_48862 [Smallanthus sonchifolius]|uniref:Uncharacterized protein n=1 Tax=Smallanthus sonchifolius TaxID=185202 RepID=A0ACB9FUS6_9ASTR|nr:hypothetical protein L1987_48862 [Smallanthus sonchifolius]
MKIRGQRYSKSWSKDGDGCFLCKGTQTEWGIVTGSSSEWVGLVAEMVVDVVAEKTDDTCYILKKGIATLDDEYGIEIEAKWD